MTAFKVKITGPNGAIVFDASAPIAETRQANYDGYNIVHLPTTIHAYRNTDGRRFSISGKLISRTAAEAMRNIKNLDLARAWVLPDFGGTGATPPILKIYGYNNYNLNGRQVILRSYAWNFPEDVDYIWEGDEAMPVIGVLQLDFDEVYSAEQITSMEWQIAEGSEAAAKAVGAKGKTTSNVYDFSSSPKRNFIRASNALSGPGSLSTIGSAIENGVKPTVPGMILGALTRNLGKKLLNSPKVREVIGGLPPVVGNIFVAGGNVLINQAGKAVTQGVSTVRLPSSNSFERDTAPTPPTIIEGN